MAAASPSNPPVYASVGAPSVVPNTMVISCFVGICGGGIGVVLAAGDSFEGELAAGVDVFLIFAQRRRSEARESQRMKSSNSVVDFVVVARINN